jgi:hypothetical protein
MTSASSIIPVFRQCLSSRCLEMVIFVTLLSYYLLLGLLCSLFPSGFPAEIFHLWSLTRVLYSSTISSYLVRNTNYGAPRSVFFSDLPLLPLSLEPVSSSANTLCPWWIWGSHGVLLRILHMHYTMIWNMQNLTEDKHVFSFLGGIFQL